MTHPRTVVNTTGIFSAGNPLQRPASAQGRGAMPLTFNVALRLSYSLVKSVRRNVKHLLRNAALLGRFLPKLRTPVNFVCHRGFLFNHLPTENTQ